MAETTPAVPDEIRDALAVRLFDDAHEGCDEGCHGTPRSYYEEYAEALLEETILPALRPEIERQAREQAAAEIAARAEEFADTRTGPRASFRRGMLAAARLVAPKLTPREVVDAITNGDAVVCNSPEVPR